MRYIFKLNTFDGASLNLTFDDLDVLSLSCFFSNASELIGSNEARASPIDVMRLAPH